MVVAVNQPNQKKGGLLGDLVQAVSLASNIYGMKVDHDKLALLEQQAADNKDMEAQKAITDLYKSYEVVPKDKAIPDFKPSYLQLPEDKGLNLRKAKTDGLMTPLQSAQLKKIEAETAAIKNKGTSGPSLDDQLKTQLLKDKIDAKIKITPTQAETINDFETTIKGYEDLVNQMSKTNDWKGAVGFVDSKKPNAALNEQEALFSMQLDQLFNQYRKAITGAGASAQELARLERSVPSTGDNQNNLPEKTKAFIKILKQKANTYLGTIEKTGKKVDDFKASFMDNVDQITPKGNSGEAIAAPASKPDTIMQNGILYKLNRTNGKYE